MKCTPLYPAHHAELYRAELKNPVLMKDKYDLCNDPVYQQLNTQFWQSVIDRLPPAVTEKVNDALWDMMQSGKEVFGKTEFTERHHAPVHR